MADIAKLNTVIADIEEHPETWRQGTWGRKNECGTAGCLAFRVGVLDGAEMKWSTPTDDGEQALLRIGDMAPADYAQRSLGLSDSQASALFDGGNNLGDLKELRDELEADPDADLSYYSNEDDD